VLVHLFMQWQTIAHAGLNKTCCSALDGPHHAALQSTVCRCFRTNVMRQIAITQLCLQMPRRPGAASSMAA
jgi:hypothetical protein